MNISWPFHWSFVAWLHYIRDLELEVRGVTWNYEWWLSIASPPRPLTGGEMNMATKTPQRIQLRRTKGFRLPANTVVVSRPSKWGNPYFVGDGVCNSKTDAVSYYRRWIESRGEHGIAPSVEEIRRELAGKNLACWCKPTDCCHADVLIELANSEGK